MLALATSPASQMMAMAFIEYFTFLICISRSEEKTFLSMKCYPPAFPIRDGLKITESMRSKRILTTIAAVVFTAFNPERPNDSMKAEKNLYFNDLIHYP